MPADQNSKNRLSSGQHLKRLSGIHIGIGFSPIAICRCLSTNGAMSFDGRCELAYFSEPQSSYGRKVTLHTLLMKMPRKKQFGCWECIADLLKSSWPSRSLRAANQKKRSLRVPIIPIRSKQ